MTTPDANLQQRLRQLPSIDRLLQLPAAERLTAEYGRSLTLDALRASLEAARQNLLAGQNGTPAETKLIEAAETWLADLLAATLQPVINATGIIIHTNLGRAPLSEAALTAVAEIGGSYSTLEYDPAAAARGSRTIHAEQLLQRLSGAEAALVVNNNAAAVLLMLIALCQDREVIISRSQLVEIGGGFRIPDVMAQSGARLVEVGTTNRTHLRDYEAAITEQTAAVMVAHHSNYKIIGFTAEPTLAELAELAHAHNLPLLYDQGSGALLDVAPYGLEPEPTVLDGLHAGCDVVAFSGDKLLGGPQAGILCGRSQLIDQLKRHPLARAVRADKMALAALAATLRPYLADQAQQQVPVWRMIARPMADIRQEAESWAAQLRHEGLAVAVHDGRSRVGGGSLPGASLPTCVVAISHSHIEQLAARLRTHSLPVIGRIQDDQLLLDPRTVLPRQIDPLLAALIQYGRP